MRRALIIVGKAPEAGRTKTRLTPPLSAEEAAALYGGFLLDTVELALGLGWERVTLVHPRTEGPLLRALLPYPVDLLEQHGAGLGDALAHAFVEHFQQGFDVAVLIGSDSPTLPREPIEEACAALADAAADLSIGPTSDGGYYLIGLREPQPGIFEDIAWSTPRVYAQTLTQANLLGLRVHAVREWYDVDEPADLERLQRELYASPPEVAAHTRAALPTHLDGGTRSVAVRADRSAY